MKYKFGIVAGLAAGIMALAVCTVSAQTAPASVWSSTKEVQKVANKQLFEDESIKGSHIHAVVLSPKWNISKGVAAISRSSDVGKANVAGGSSDWQISKDVQKIQRKRNVQ